MPSRKGWHFFMSGKTCSFFGHREINLESGLADRLKKTVESLIFDKGYTQFYFGGFGDFDALCYKTVTEIKVNNPNLQIKRVFCVPQERLVRKGAPYFNKDDYEETVFLEPSFNGWYKSIYFRNLAMIDASDFVVFYAEEKERSGAYKALQYATKTKKEFVNIFLKSY